MNLIADTHLHFYPCYNFDLALDSLRKNLAGLDDKAVCIGILTEATGYNVFDEIKNKPAQSAHSKRKLRYFNNAIHIQEFGFPDLFLFQGRQIVTKENIEILCLLTEPGIENGLPAQEVIDAIRQKNGLPVLSWSPGKWFFKRGKLVGKLLRTNPPGSFLIGDTSLRPLGWPFPRLMKKAKDKGFLIISGSDPLPFPGEEKHIGSYGIRINCEFDPNNPAESLRSFLLQTKSKPELIGKRGSLFSVLKRLHKLFNTKRKKSTEAN